MPAPGIAAANRSGYCVMSQFVMKPPYEWPTVATRCAVDRQATQHVIHPGHHILPSFVPQAPHVPHRNFSP